jgi:hypothetical protein
MLALGERLTRGGDVGLATRVGPELQIVLGLSMTSTSVGWVLLDRERPDAVTLDHDAFDVKSGAEGTAPDTSQHTAAARGAQAIATASGHKVGSVQMTWSEDIEADAKALLKSLADLGFDNVVAIPLNQATQTWAIEVGRANEHDKTALCVLEPGTATVMVIATGAGSVRTAVTNTREHAADLVDWLTTIFNGDGWLPESLHLVGSRDDLDAVTGPLGDALPIPVFDSVDTQLALARGAALATHSHVAAGSSQVAATPRSDPGPQRDRPWLVSNAKRVTTSAAAVAVVGAALSLAAGSTLNVENVSTQAANSPVADASVTSASVHSVSAPDSAPPVSPVQALAAEPTPAPPAPPETPVRPAQPLAAVEPEPASVPVPQQTVSAAPVAAPAAPTVPPSAAAIAPPPAAPIVPPPAAPLAAPIALPPAAPIALPPAAPIALPPAAPIALPPAAPIALPPAAPIALPPAAPIALPPAAPAAAAPTAPLAAPPAPMAPPPAPVVPPDPAGPPPPQDPMAVVSNLLFGGLP